MERMLLRHFYYIFWVRKMGWGRGSSILTTIFENLAINLIAFI